MLSNSFQCTETKFSMEAGHQTLQFQLATSVLYITEDSIAPIVKCRSDNEGTSQPDHVKNRGSGPALNETVSALKIKD